MDIRKAVIARFLSNLYYSAILLRLDRRHAAATEMRARWTRPGRTGGWMAHGQAGRAPCYDPPGKLACALAQPGASEGSRTLFAALLCCLVMLWPWRLVLPSPAAALFPDKASARIVISQNDQRMRIFEGDVLYRTLPVSTGDPSSRITSTPPWQGAVGRYWGTFSSYGTTQDHGYQLFTDYLPNGQWNGTILIHGAPYNIGEDGQKVYKQEHIGQEPLSHGCIQLLPEDAEWFRAWDPVGVPVTIEPLDPQAGLVPRAAVAIPLE
jgi:hypothetical protein